MENSIEFIKFFGSHYFCHILRVNIPISKIFAKVYVKIFINECYKIKAKTYNSNFKGFLLTVKWKEKDLI